MRDEVPQKLQSNVLLDQIAEAWFKFFGYAALTGLVQSTAATSGSIAVNVMTLVSYGLLGWWAAGRVTLFFVEFLESSGQISGAGARVGSRVLSLCIVLVVLYFVWQSTTTLIQSFLVHK